MQQDGAAKVSQRISTGVFGFDDITDGGLPRGGTLADVYSAGGEVLMGPLRWEKENQERRERANHESSARLREQKAALALAETSAKLETLVCARAIQQAELDELMADKTTSTELYDSDAQQLLQRRRADSLEPLLEGRSEAPQ